MIGDNAKLYETGHLVLDDAEARKVAYQSASESVVLLKTISCCHCLRVSILLLLVLMPILFGAW